MCCSQVIAKENAWDRKVFPVQFWPIRKKVWNPCHSKARILTKELKQSKRQIKAVV